MMEQVDYPGGWQRYKNIVVYDKFWQQPAKTEQWAYEKLLECNHYDPKTHYVCFPWATLIDAINSESTLADELLVALECRPPKYGVKVITYCQHIYALKFLNYFKKLGVTDLYWSHKTRDLDVVDGIRLHPYPLYPVMHYKRQKPYKNKPLKDRKYLYSFIGSYQPGLYLTEVRKWIFDLPKRDDAVVIERSEWHFEQDVYRSQLLGEAEDEVSKRIRGQYEREYTEVMEETVFCLCPSGTGPNSIRLWEAIEFGCMPIVLSDSLDLGILNYQSKKFIQLPEKKEAIIDFFEERSVSFR